MTTTATLTPGRYLEKVRTGSFVRVDDLPGSRAAASCALSRASKRGDVVPVRRGLYFKGKRTRYGTLRPSAFQVATEVLGTHGVGPSGYSAARAFGLTTQLPVVPEYAVAGPLPSAVPGVRLHRRNNMMRRELGPLEVALLELLRDWDTVAECSWAQLVEAVSDAVARRRIRRPRLDAAAAAEANALVRERYGRLTAELDRQGTADVRTGR